jgi:hypothetical protein
MTNVTKINYCAECNKPMVRGKGCKNCNPNLSHDEKQKINYACSFRENGTPCNSTFKTTRIGPQANIPQFWCLYHYEKYSTRIKTDPEKKMERNVDVFRHAIKDSSLHPSKFFREHFGYDVKDAAKNLTATK